MRVDGSAKDDAALEAGTIARVNVGPYEQKRYPGRGTREDPFVVDWDLGDPENPYNWTKSRKWLITLQVSRTMMIYIDKPIPT